jgi:hypothetical protein
MRYTTWLIYSDNAVMLRGGGYGLACVNEDGSVNFGFGAKDINKNNPYRDAPASDVKKIRNNALLVKIPEIDKFMGEGLLLVPETDPYFNAHILTDQIYYLEGVALQIDHIISDAIKLSIEHVKKNYLKGTPL